MTPIQVVQSVTDAFLRGDIPYIIGLVAPGAVWRQTKVLPWGGDYTGPEGAAEFFTKLDASMETVAFEVNEMIASGDEVFSFGRYAGRGRATGKVGDMQWMFRWKVVDGRIVSYVSYVDSGVLLAALN